ncbi:hypothetical protein JTB14_024535 [Gonioctena quinquepunctata]|nr:hypothetical protein JTB14_024535 [Gonioctena quinquepunctata]
MAEVSDNDYDSDEDASEPSVYEEHTDTDDEVRSDKTVIAERNSKGKIMIMFDRGGGGGSQMMNSLEYCLPQSMVDTNPQSTNQKQN